MSLDTPMLETDYQLFVLECQEMFQFYFQM